MPKHRRTLEHRGLSDGDYMSIMEKVANENYTNWGFDNPDEALLYALNDKTYNYRGYYNKYPKGKGNAIDHWTDEFKTVYHPTFSNESIYSGKVDSNFNPNGFTGGMWLNDIYIPPKYQSKSRIKFAKGGKITSKRDNVYIVQKGDTLGAIARRLSGNAKTYLQLANINNISNPDLINVGQEIIIPEKFDKPLKFNEIPTNNRISIIDDYSPHYNYIVEGNKIYYSRKGHNDYWVDISNNQVARKNLFNHIGQKYNYRGYEDNEREIGEKIKNNTYNYNEEIKPKRRFKLSGDIQINPIIQQPSSLYVKRQDFNTPTTQSSKTIIEDILDNTTDIFQKGKNYISRQYKKLVGDRDSRSVLDLPKQRDVNSSYGIMPASYTGDTIKVNKDQYIIPESINLNDVRLGVRNRGERTPLNTEGAIITNFNGYTPYNKIDKTNKTTTYMGVDRNGKFKVGNIDSFEEGDVLTKTFENEVESFAKDANGNQIWKDDKAHGNPGRSVPVLNVIQNGKQIKGSLNLLTSKNKQDSNTYGWVTGGRVIFKAGDETRLVSGSIADIEKQFNDIKKRHGVKTVKMYTLDAGSYNRGFRTYNKKITAEQQKAYDNMNSSGGNFMYLLDNKPYSSDTILTPNVRTINDVSYKKGHPLTNEQKGVVLHHTGFEDKNLESVTKHLTNPKSEASSHVIIGYDGKRRVLASPDKVTFHAGHSVWNNRQDVNDFMIGIEFQGDTNKRDLTQDQIKSAIDYLKPIIRKNNISLENITTHEKVRALYNQFAAKQGKQIAPNKPDINSRNYEKIINTLIKELYYKKPKRNLETKTKFSTGGSIHIAPSKRGTFTAAASKHGMGVQEFANRVLANKENYSPAMVKKANFARNASKWKH